MSKPVIAAVIGLLLAGPAAAAPPSPRPALKIVTEDVARFYQVYDAAGGAPDAQALQHGYLDPGTPGLHDFIAARIGSADKLAAAIAKSKPAYDGARRCAAVLPEVREGLTRALTRLARAYPQARFPPATVMIGRNNSGGTTGPNGVLIGLEVLCRADWLEPNLRDRFVHLITHEYAHVQQHPDGGEDQTPGDLLAQSLDEGGADFTAELFSGQTGTAHLKRWTRGHELQIETAFAEDRHSKDLSKWLYNGLGTPDKPGDLGYWVGYRIVKSYYLHAHDKRQALRDIYHITDPDAFLARSGWTPGMKLPG